MPKRFYDGYDQLFLKKLDKKVKKEPSKRNYISFYSCITVDKYWD